MEYLIGVILTLAVAAFAFIASKMQIGWATLRQRTLAYWPSAPSGERSLVFVWLKS
jgi:hypothetical protein